MIQNMTGFYRNGKVELAQPVSNIKENTQVIVTFLEPHDIDLQRRGIDKNQAAELRARLATFASDWDSPEMEIYDNYEAIKAKL